jgi:hypothetical protein
MEYLFRNPIPVKIPMLIQSFGLFCLIILKASQAIRSHKNCSVQFGVNSVSKIKKPGDKMNGTAVIKSAIIPPPDSLMIFAMINTEAAPRTAGMNLIPKTE